MKKQKFIGYYKGRKPFNDYYKVYENKKLFSELIFIRVSENDLDRIVGTAYGDRRTTLKNFIRLSREEIEFEIMINRLKGI